METRGRPTLLGYVDQFKILHSIFYNRVSECPSSHQIQGAEHQASGARRSKIFKDRGKFSFENYTMHFDLYCYMQTNNQMRKFYI